MKNQTVKASYSCVDPAGRFRRSSVRCRALWADAGFVGSSYAEYRHADFSGQHLYERHAYVYGDGAGSGRERGYACVSELYRLK